MSNSSSHNNSTKKKEGWNVKEPVRKEDQAPKQRVDIRPADFDRLLQQKGVNLKVYRSLYCPNVKSVDAGEHNIDCTLCNGSGFMDLEPLCTLGYIQNQELEVMNAQDGNHDGNSVLITFPIGVEVQYFTRIELIDFTEIYYQRVLRKPGSNVDVLKYRACRVNIVVNSAGDRYYQDQDFKIDPNGNILWLLDDEEILRAPADNQVYSIHYECHVQFRAVKAMHVCRFTQYRNEGSVQHLKLPEQWLCSKEYLLRRKDINTGNDLIEGPFANHTDTTGDNG